jgi:hypothetical protein
MSKEADKILRLFNQQVASVKLINKIKDWLKEEIRSQKSVVNGSEVLSDGTYGIIEGRYECAESLLDQIKKWEKANEQI